MGRTCSQCCRSASVVGPASAEARTRRVRLHDRAWSAAGPGPYWLGVAGFGVSFQNAFGTAGTWTGGSISVGFETNTNGSALAASVSAGSGSGRWCAPVPRCSVAQRHNRHRLPNPPLDEVQPLPHDQRQQYRGLRLHPVRCSPAVGWGLFNSLGNLVTNAAATTTPPTVTFDGSTPALTLASGDYYLALVYNYGIDYGQHPATDGRWHIRGEATSNFPDGVQVGVSWSDCPVAGGCTADFKLRRRCRHRLGHLCVLRLPLGQLPGVTMCQHGRLQ